MRQRIAAAVLSVGIVVAAWAGQPEGEVAGAASAGAAGGSGTGAWKHHLSFDESLEGVRSVAFSPDGGTLYVLYHVGAVDVWPIVVAYWPEWAGALVALLTVGAVWWVVRVRRRPQRVGAPHCRGCNYELSAQVGVRREGRRVVFDAPVGGKCPECGVGLGERRPRRGRGFFRRVALVAGVWIVAVAVYGGMWAAGVPRAGVVGRWVSWPSVALAEYADDRSIAWMQKLKKPCDRVVAVDVETGATVRVVATGSRRTYTDLRVSPDGGSLFLAGGEREVVRVGTRRGRVLGRVVVPGTVTVDVSGESVIGFSADGGTAYVQWVDRATAVSGVSAWDLDSGESEVLVRTAAYVDRRSGRAFPHGRLFRPLGGDGRRFLSWPQFMESYGTKTFVLRVHEAGAAGVDRGREISPEPLPGWHAEPAVTPDGKAAFFSVLRGGGIVGVDLERGETMGVLRTERTDLIGETLAMSGDGRLLAAPMVQNRVFVRDVVAKRWVARLEYPSELYGPEPVLSADGRWLAAVCQKGSTGAFTHEVVVWDLGELAMSEEQ